MSAESPIQEKKEAQIWKECTSLQSQMKKSLKSNNNPFRAEIEELRSKLRENYLYLLEDHASFSFTDKDVLVNLWKFVFYKQIEFCRKQLRNNKQTQNNKEKNKERLQLINKLTDKIIPDAKSVYNGLLNKHLKKSFISQSISRQTFSDELIINTTTDKDKEISIDISCIRLSVMIAHKSLIYIGDLERYRETYLNGNYEIAQLSYCLALQLMPIRGNPHNQLAVLNQMQINCDLAAIYRYVLSLFVIEPFMTAKENLSLLFKKTVSLIDKNNINQQQLIKSIQTKNTWNELQIYVIYILAILYQENYRKNVKYHKLLNKIQPIILEKISKILLIKDDEKEKEIENEEDNDNDNNNNNDKEEEQEIGEQDNNNIIKQLCIISIFLVIECFNEKNNYIGYKQSISWTLSLIATMMEYHNESILGSITFCCLWLRHNFDFAVPDINESPWMEMQIDQNDLKSNNKFFSQFAKLLNILYTKYKHKYHQFDTDLNKYHHIITPEQVEFYGVKQLNFINFNDSKYKNNTNYAFIYHRRFCSKNNKKLKFISNTKKHGYTVCNNKKTLNYIRYLKLVQFAQYSSQKIEGVLVFNNTKWTANKLLTIEEPQQQQQQNQNQNQNQNQHLFKQSHSAQNAASNSPPSQSPPSNLPPLPLKQKSQPDTYYNSPIYPNRYPLNNTNNIQNNTRTPIHLPSQHTMQTTQHPMHLNSHQIHFNLPTNHHHNHHNHNHNHHNISRSAPSSPRGTNSNNHQHHHHMHPSHYMFKPQAPLIEDEITFDGYPENMIKSTPTTPMNASQQFRYNNPPNSNNNQQQQQQQQPLPPSRYAPQSMSYENLQHSSYLYNHPEISSSDHEYEQNHNNYNNNNNNQHNKPPLAPTSHLGHSGHTAISHSFQIPPRSVGVNNGIPAPSTSGPLYGGSQSVRTPNMNANTFDFSTAYAHAAANTPLYGGTHSSIQPVTQPTTPVFASHHSNNSYSSHPPTSTHLLPGTSPHHHPLYPHHSHHNNPMTASSKYEQNHININNNNNNQYVAPPRTPNNSTVLNFTSNEMSSPLFCADIVSEVFTELQLSQQ